MQRISGATDRDGIRPRAKLLDFDALLPAVSILVLLILWKLISLSVSERYVPSPEGTISTMVSVLLTGSTYHHLGATLARTVVGFALAMTLGILVGTCMGLYRRGELLFRLPVVVGLTIPSLCYIIVTFMWFGLNERAAVAAVALTTFPSIAVNIWAGVKAIDGRLIGMAKVFGHNERARMVRVVLPQVFPYIVAAARFGFGIVWKVVAVVELLGMSNGVGYQLNYYFQLFDIRSVFAWTLLFTLVMVLIELLILKPLEFRVFRWRPELRA